LNPEKADKALLERVAALEARLDDLANHTSSLTSNIGASDRLLVSWNEISRYCRKGQRSLARYTKTMAFPAFRSGRHTVSSPCLIDQWLLTVHRMKQQDKLSKGVATARP